MPTPPKPRRVASPSHMSNPLINPPVLTQLDPRPPRHPASSPKPSKDSQAIVPAPPPLPPREALSYPRPSHQLHAQPSPPPYSPHYPPSPSTTAAAMSLGALAAAASMAAAATSPSSSLAPTAIPPSYNPAFSSQRPPSFMPQPRHHHPFPTQLHDHKSPQPLPPFSAPHMHATPAMVPAPAMSQMPRPKTNPTPVAPAPTNMHPSQQQATHPNGKPKQRRYRATPEQLRQLIARFEVNPSPSSAELQELAAKINMPAQSAVLWFKNRRARVPHKKAEKALAAKRRENGELPVAGGVSKQRSPKDKEKTSVRSKEVAVEPSSAFSEEVAAAASMAEMAMAVAEGQEGTETVGRDTTNQGKRTESLPSPSPSKSPPPLYRNRASEAVPFDIGLVTRLSGGNKTGAEFVATSTTPRRPRVVPPTPRLFSQKEYEHGEKVEVLETSKGICRSWYAASIVGRAGLKELSLGESAGTLTGTLAHTGSSAVKDLSKGENASEGQDDGGDSPRTVRSPAASPTPPLAKVAYLVKYEHRFDGEDGKTHLEEDVLASRIRPAPPFNSSSEDWRPEAGEAVEVLRDGAWFVAVIQNFAVRKGYMVSFESGDVQWVRRDGLRPYQIWRGGELWVTKTKPPLPIVRKSVGLSVTHPPGGKRKRTSVEGGNANSSGSSLSTTREGRETRGRSKRAKSMFMEGSGPDGLPEGWRIDYMRRNGFTGRNNGQTCYIAPDGNRLRSLKEAQRYVRMMGPG